MDVRLESDSRPWKEPGVYRVSPRIYRIPLPLADMHVGAVNVYVVLGQSGSVLLIDAGTSHPDSHARLSEGIASIGCSMEEISKILVTHAHSDHYAGAMYLRRQYGTSISFGVGEQSSILGLMGDAPLSARFQILRQHGAASLADALAAAEYAVLPGGYGLPDNWLCDQDLVSVDQYTLQALETPGHTQGHMVFVDRDQDLMFSGDHILPSITPSVGVEVARSSQPLHSFITSLKTLRPLGDCALLPAHGPVGGSAHRRIDEILDHHRTRLNLIASSLVGRDTAFSIARWMLWVRGKRRFESLDLRSRMLAVLEVLAHLELLVAEDRVSRRMVRGVYRFWER